MKNAARVALENALTEAEAAEAQALEEVARGKQIAATAKGAAVRARHRITEVNAALKKVS